MEFKPVFVYNPKVSGSSAPMSTMAAPAAQGVAVRTLTFPDKENMIKETASKRRRRRRQNNALKHILGMGKSSDLEHLSGENSPGPYSPKGCDPDGIPSLNVLPASPSPMLQEHPQPKERVPLDVLKAIADRARERLAVRIQAYWDEKQYVAEAASNIQRAYAQHMESQLQTIIQAMGEHLTREIDIRFEAHTERSHEVLRQSFAEFRMEIARNQRREDDKLREHQGRIVAVEVQINSILEMLKRPPTPPPFMSPVDASMHLHSRTEQLHDLLQDLRLTHEGTVKQMNEIQTTLTTHIVARDRQMYTPQAASRHGRTPSLVDISNGQSPARPSSTMGSPSRGSNRTPVKRTHPANAVMVGSVECL